ncbi:DoxX family membrane protein [Planotetraspora sp. A-T 1434]|uniref:DoxX family protein n=1 Tax=Planotetraspora sp. A-T 1434 TaxID=2979219 RepID=UPI0021BF5412|nr:DoxX family membrane protein [Planotetraspora sp. A-T 1434]MCT9929908.1 DoxX family membrane protein [Planotetraspora sp. A-T 1434]
MTASPSNSLDHSNSFDADEQGAPRHAYDAGLLLLRLVLGLTMAGHGAQKLFGWFSGPGLDVTGQFFTSVGYPAGKAMAVVDGLSELLGGLGLAVGVLTPLAGAAVIGVMVNAVAVKWGGGFFIPTGWEYELTLATGAAALALTGPGRLALDRHLPVVRAHRVGYGIASVALGLVLGAVVLLFRG